MDTAAKPRVLIADDEADFGALVARWLSPHFDAVAVTDGDSLVRELERGGASLLVLDVSMPGEDGLTLCRRLRADGRWAATPVLFLTGDRSEDIYLRNLRAGGTGYLAKPVGRRRLLDAVKELVPGTPDAADTGGEG